MNGAPGAEGCAREPRGEVARAPRAAVPRKERRVKGESLASGTPWGIGADDGLDYRGW